MRILTRYLNFYYFLITISKQKPKIEKKVTIMVGDNMDGPKRDYVLKLMESKSKIEREIGDHQEILKTNNIGMREPLVDDQGYPRNDIDVYQVRHARNKIIMLQNDLKKVMEMIEKGLIDAHSDYLGRAPETQRSVAAQNGHANSHADSGPHLPFAVITSVQDGSPSATAGLCANDKIIRFGSLTHSNFNDINQISTIVSHSVGQEINVQVLRSRLVVSVTLVPRPWANPGLLGCHIQKIDPEM